MGSGEIQTLPLGEKLLAQNGPQTISGYFVRQQDKKAMARLARLATKHLEFNFSVQHIAGGKNVKAIFLSRLPVQDPSPSAKDEEDIEECIIATVDDTVICANMEE